jgi:hypothetical protein
MANTPPVVTISNHTLNFAQWAQVQPWLSYSDADGNAPVAFQFWDSGVGADTASYWTPNGYVAPNTTLEVSAANLSSVWVQGGNANVTDSLWVRAFDGTSWGNWHIFTLTTHDDPPTVSVSDHTLNMGQWAQMQNWISYSDSNGDAATKYQFWDSGTGADSASFWTPNGYVAPNTTLEVSASDLASVWVQGGNANGTDSMWVRAFDGHEWGNWDIFTLTTHDDPPTVLVTDHTLNMGQWAQMKNWISYSDSNGDAATKYQFWDSGTGADSASFWTPNGYVAPNTTLEVSASDLASVWVQGGNANGTDSMWVRAFDGHEWGNWDIFMLTTHDDPPTVSVSDHTLKMGQWAQMQNWISYSDNNGDAATKYQFWDSGTGAASASFWTPNGYVAPNTTLEVSASDLASVWVQGGTANGTDSMWVRAFDGHEWGNWDIFTLTTQPNTPPVATISPPILHLNEWTQVQSMLAYSDADGDAAVKFQFWDAGTGASSGYFWTPGTGQVAANTTVEVAASDLANVWLRGGTNYGYETMWVRAFDGKDWSSWDGFTVTSDDGPVVTPVSASTKSFANQSFSAGSLFNYTSPLGAAVQYDFWNSGGGGGHFVLSGTTLQANHDNIIGAAQLGQLSYVVGTGTDTLWIRASDGKAWGAWSSGFTMADPPAVAAGETITLGSACSGRVDFLGDTGTLKLEDSSSFAGTVAGLRGQDAIDLADIGFGAHPTLGYAANTDGSGGTLSVSDGTHMANIALLGSYMASSFVAASDGHGGTLISETAQSTTQLQPHG